jgi:uncharacterized protein
MTPRPRTPRKISNPPEIKGFRPYGGDGGKSSEPYINLLFEEYEALRLCDFDHYNHQQASDLMEVSRPTFTRIYASALKKIAQAFVEGRGILIQGGHVYFDSDWYYCSHCDSNFNQPELDKLPGECPLCGYTAIETAGSDFSAAKEKRVPGEVVYVCMECGTEKPLKTADKPLEQRCKLCNVPMRLKEQKECKDFNHC